MPSPLTDARARRVAQLTALGAVAIGLVVLLGWVLAVPTLTNFGVGDTRTRPASALALVGLGTALVLGCDVTARSVSVVRS